jgi:hypothetical protein
LRRTLGIKIHDYSFFYRQQILSQIKCHFHATDDTLPFPGSGRFPRDDNYLFFIVEVRTVTLDPPVFFFNFYIANSNNFIQILTRLSDVFSRFFSVYLGIRIGIYLQNIGLVSDLISKSPQVLRTFSEKINFLPSFSDRNLSALIFIRLFSCSFFKVSLDVAEKALSGVIPKRVRLTKNMIRGLKVRKGRILYLVSFSFNSSLCF